MWGEEWDKLTHYFSYDVGVQVLQDKSGGPEGGPPATVYRTYPSELWVMCHMLRMECLYLFVCVKGLSM